MNVLVVGAHPDDEAIGCGGAMILHARANDTVTSLFLTSGEQGRGGEDPAGTGELREAEAARASQYLMQNHILFLRGRDGALRADAAIVQAIIAQIRERAITLLYAPSINDAHSDHREAGEACVSARFATDIELRTYEVWTPLAKPNFMIDITGAIGDKIAAIRAHRSQCDRVRFDEAAYALARYRGEMQNRPHGPFAEAFVREEAKR